MRIKSKDRRTGKQDKKLNSRHFAGRQRSKWSIGTAFLDSWFLTLDSNKLCHAIVNHP